MIADIQPTAYNVFDENGIIAGRASLTADGRWFCIVTTPEDNFSFWRENEQDVRKFFSYFAPRWELRADD